MQMIKQWIKLMLVWLSGLLLQYIGVPKLLHPKVWVGLRPMLLRMMWIDYAAQIRLGWPHHFAELGVRDNVSKVIISKLDESRIIVTNPDDAGDIHTYYWLPRRNYELSNVVFDPRSGLVLINGMVVSESSTTFPQPDLVSANLAWRCRSPQKIEAQSCSGMKWAYNYAHWLTEDLMSLLHIRRQFGDHVPLITPTKLARFQVEALNLLGVNRIEIDNPVLCQKFLLAGHHQRSEAALRPSDIFLLRETFLPLGLDSLSRPKDLSIYVSRSKTKGVRSLAHEETLERMLVNHGFLVVHTQDLQFAEEIALFSKAKVIVGITGSGLINHLWMPPGGTIIEIRIIDFYDTSYRYSGPILDLDYSLIDFRKDSGDTQASEIMCKICECL